MKKEEVQLFEGKCVKIERTNGFVLYGTIEQVNEDNLLFVTKNGTSIISFDSIAGIVSRNEVF
jgi:hypothetical protein